jgi:DNA segregation ATPase FtsK/SpoIIIE, S-DNA-T family
MLEHRNLKLDIFALGLVALTVFLAVALFSYDPADPPSKLVFPERAETLNICGRWGALAAKLLLTALGLGAYYLVFSLAALDCVLLTRHKVTRPVLRGAGWLLSLFGAATLAAMAMPRLSPGPVIGSGGYLGATGRGFMELNFATVGAYILTISLLLGGLLLTTDYILIRIVAWAIGRPTTGFGRGVVRVGSAYAQKLGMRRSDLDAYEENDIAVRISGRGGEEDAEEDAADSEEDAEESETAGKEAASAKPKVPAMRIAPPRKTDRQQMIEELENDNARRDAVDYELPALDLLLPGETYSFEEQEKEVRRKAKILEKTFADFGFNIRVVEIQTGPVIAQFEVELEAGLRLSKITGLADDLAIALRVPSVRIVAPIPGKNTVGIEVPNNERLIVHLREVMEEANGKSSRMRIPLFLGKDVSGNPMTVDLSSLPHLLIAGRTGTGKSVCLNSIIASILMTRRPDEVRLLLIDPKMVELSPYKCLPHLMHPVVTDMRKAEAILAWAVDKMEERYHLLARAGVRHVSVYNQLGEEELMERLQPTDEEERKLIPTHMPYLVIVADELADLMMTAAKEVEGHIIRLAQKSRAVGIHLVLATQKPTVDVITGLIKSNLPARICFQVASRTDSRVVLDEMGADKLLGNGDMLFLWPGTSTIIRGQGTYLSDDEINGIIGKVATTEPQYIKELVQLKAAEPADGKSLNSRDELYESAIDLVIREGRGSVSLLQRSLGIGYGRAARLIDFMAEDGFVGPYNGSQAREVLLTVEEWERRNGQSPDEDSAPSRTAPARNNKIMLDRPEDSHPPLPALAVPKTAPAIEPDEDGESKDESERKNVNPVDEADETDYEEDEFDEEEYDDEEEDDYLEDEDAEDDEYDEDEDEDFDEDEDAGSDDDEANRYDEADDEASEEDEESSVLTSGDKHQSPPW